jgi:hypothetical protein
MKKQATASENACETSLIAAFNAAVANHMKYDSREEGNYFEHGAEKTFQRLATQTAVLIDEQGVQNTAPVLLAIAREVQAVGEIGWDHANSIGFAVKRGLESDGGTAGKAGNPFRKMKF